MKGKKFIIFGLGAVCGFITSFGKEDKSSFILDLPKAYRF